MILRTLTLLTLAYISSTVMASGSREIAISDCIEKQCTVVNIMTLDKDSHYLGSTDTWHLFAKVLTSHSENDDGSVAMPFDTVVGYKVPVADATVSHPYTLTPEDYQSIAVIRECVQVVAMDEKTKSIEVSKGSSSCLIK